MARFEGSVEIMRPVEEVFAHITEVSNWTKWAAGMLEAEQTSEGPVGVGTTCRGVTQSMGRKMDWTSEVTKYEQNKKMEQKITSGSMTIEQSFAVEPVEGGTRFTIVSEAEIGGFFKMADAVVNRMWKKQMEDMLAALKDILEAQA